MTDDIKALRDRAEARANYARRCHRNESPEAHALDALRLETRAAADLIADRLEMLTLAIRDHADKTKRR